MTDFIKEGKNVTLGNFLAKETKTMHKLKQGCEVCHGKGWVNSWSEKYGQRIERCDECEVFKNDDDACDAVCNSHEALVEALKRLTNRLGMDINLVEYFAKEALLKAGVKV